MSAQRLRRWSNIVQMIYKGFVFTEIQRILEVDCVVHMTSQALVYHVLRVGED